MRRRVGAVARLLVGAVLVGVVAGAASFVFLEGLDAVTAARIDHPWLVVGLPLVGLAVGLAVLRLGPAVSGGTAVVLDRARHGGDDIPVALAPYALLGTWATHLVGGSAGREGTALQLAGPLGDVIARRLRLDVDGRRHLLVAAVAAGFGSVFGVPLAGTVFALEIGRKRRPRPVVALAALVAAFVGDAVVDIAGHAHAVRPRPVPDGSLRTVVALAVVGSVCGAAAVLYVAATRGVRAVQARVVRRPQLRPVLGGVLVLAAAGIVGPAYLGLSLPLADTALAGAEVAAAAWLCKLLLTAVTVGSGFPGGEVTPLFVVGSTLAAVVAPLVGVDPVLAAACGFVATFAAAAGTPLAGVVMAAEVFGIRSAPAALLVCLVAAIVARRVSLYDTPPTSTPVSPAGGRRRRAG